MDFLAFLILLVIALVVAAILHFGFKLYVVQGFTSFLSKVIIAWVGARIGTPILGEWFGGVNYGDVYIIPAILGAAAILVLAVDIVNTVKK